MEDLIQTLKNRFDQNLKRHPQLNWADVETRIKNSPKLQILAEMEASGGEPDVIDRDPKSGAFLFADCSAESPSGRRSLCYDRQALEGRKNHPPANDAESMARAMGLELLSEEQYINLQKLGPFDLKTSSWLKTPEDIRSKGGAIFGDCRYGQVFIYHNGADSYYAARGFRGCVWV